MPSHNAAALKTSSGSEPEASLAEPVQRFKALHVVGVTCPFSAERALGEVVAPVFKAGDQGCLPAILGTGSSGSLGEAYALIPERNPVDQCVT